MYKRTKITNLNLYIGQHKLHNLFPLSLGFRFRLISFAKFDIDIDIINQKVLQRNIEMNNIVSMDVIDALHHLFEQYFGDRSPMANLNLFICDQFMYISDEIKKWIASEFHHE